MIHPGHIRKVVVRQDNVDRGLLHTAERILRISDRQDAEISLFDNHLHQGSLIRGHLLLIKPFFMGGVKNGRKSWKSIEEFSLISGLSLPGAGVALRTGNHMLALI